MLNRLRGVTVRLPDKPTKKLVTDGAGSYYLVDASVLAASRARCRTTHDVGEQTLARFCAALGHEDRAATFSALFRELGELCGARAVEEPPRWSGIGDDCSPYEFSIDVRRDGTEPRLLVEAHDEPASPLSYWNAGMRLNQWLVDHHAAHLDTFRRVQDLFEPRHSELFGVVGHGVGLGRDGRPAFKIYVNPLARDPEGDVDVVVEALTRLGYAEALDTLLALRGPADRFSHFSLDLVAGARARVKVYVKHFGLTFDDVARLAGATTGAPASEWVEFARTVLGHDRAALSERPVYTAYTMTTGRPDVIDGATLQLPILPYLSNDLEAHERIVAVLERHELPVEAYANAVDALRRGPLEHEQGLHSHVSYSRQAGQPRVAVYFGSRLYVERYGWLSLDPARSWPENCWPLPALRRGPDGG